MAVGWLFNSDALITSTGEAESVKVRSVRRVPITIISSTSLAAGVVAGADCARPVPGKARAATLALANNNLLDKRMNNIPLFWLCAIIRREMENDFTS